MRKSFLCALLFSFLIASCHQSKKESIKVYHSHYISDSLNRVSDSILLATAVYPIEDKLHLSNYEKVEDTNFKSQLQELIQANFKCKMTYQTEKVDDKFISKFFMDDDEIAMGEGLSKTEAEQNCARVVINLLFKV